VALRRGSLVVNSSQGGAVKTPGYSKKKTLGDRTGAAGRTETLVTT